MKAAFACLGERIAPVFDVAGEVRLVETGPAREILGEETEMLTDSLPVQKALRLVELGVGVLVCGAVSRPLQETVTAYGVQVVPFVAGELREVIQAWVSGELDLESFSMPGCHGRGRGRNIGIREVDKEMEEMNARGRGAMGQGGGSGRNAGSGKGLGTGQGLGRMGGASAAGTGGECVCPKCGQRQEHQRGIPCVQTKCAQCGTMMTREKRSDK